MIPKPVLPVPIEIQARPALVDVVRMVYVELPVIVFGVIDAVLSRTAIVTGHPLFGFGHGVTSVSFVFVVALFLRRVTFVPRHLRFSTGNTQYKVSMLDTSLGHGRCPLDSRQGPFPCIPRRRCRPAPDPRRFALGFRARAFPLHPASGHKKTVSFLIPHFCGFALLMPLWYHLQQPKALMKPSAMS